ncbi:hypothetical protein PMIN05_010007 [Paraphaeosphaeria minitans]
MHGSGVCNNRSFCAAHGASSQKGRDSRWYETLMYKRTYLGTTHGYVSSCLEMLAHLLTTLLLSVLTLALPHTSSNQATCTPTAYTISSYSANPTKPNQSIHLAFRSAFPDPSLVTDAAFSGTVCDTSPDPSGNFPNELTCLTGRSNLEVDLRGALGSGRLTVAHFWGCGG